LRHHPKSDYSVPGLFEGTSSFSSYFAGRAEMQRQVVHEEVGDRVRWFLEECDHPDGIHMLVDGNSGWSGAGASLLAHLRDDHERLPIFCVGTLIAPPPQSNLGRHSFAAATSRMQSALNAIMLMNSAATTATAYLPLSPLAWTAHAALQGGDADPLLQAALVRGELLESTALMAWGMHAATAAYR
jgi:hypothetical protein